mgnify:FL=1
MQEIDIIAYIKKSFAEKNTFSVFLVSIISIVLFVAVASLVAFHYRAQVFGYLAKEYVLGSMVQEDNTGEEKSVTEKIIEKQSIFTQEYFVVDAVKKTNPAVVSITLSKEVPKYEIVTLPDQQDIFGNIFPSFPQYKQNGTEKKQVGSGSGFFVSSDGLIVTNKHVVEATDVSYTVYTNDGKKHDAKVIARDPVLDIALMKIESNNYPYLNLGNSDSLLVGQTVIAIGNALGEYKNTVSVGVVSGLSRSVTAGGSLSGKTELLDHVIQTDAAINPGNSGGPLLDLSGRVVGVNVAVVTGSQGIGFALPVNSIKSAIESVKNSGKIIRPYLGVRYLIVNAEMKEAASLAVDYGALVKAGANASEPAIIPGGPAEKAGLKENDIILYIDGEKITEANSLANIIRQKKVGQTITMRVWSKGGEKTVKATLEVFKED